MKKLILLTVLFFIPLFTLSLAAQEVKQKATSESERPLVEITVNGNRVTVLNAAAGQKLEVFSVVGLKVDVITIKSGITEYILNVPKGYYILKIGETVRKVVIK